MNPFLTPGGTFTTHVEIPETIEYRLEGGGDDIVIESAYPIPFDELTPSEQKRIIAKAREHSEQVEREAKAEARLS